MRKITACFLLTLMTAGVLFSETVPHYRGIGEISGKNLSIVQAAMPAALKQHLDISKYKIIVAESEDRYLVTFADPDLPAMQVGSSPNMAEFEVELRKAGLQIINSHFIR